MCFSFAQTTGLLYMHSIHNSSFNFYNYSPMSIFHLLVYFDIALLTFLTTAPPFLIATHDYNVVHETCSGNWTPLMVASYTKPSGWLLTAHSIPSHWSKVFLIRVMCVSHHLVSLRTHWGWVHSSLRAAWCFCFWCGLFIWPFCSWGHFLGALRQDVVPHLISSVQPTV